MHGEIFFLILLLLVAFLYSSVGHGGASGYLALMAFFSFAPDTMRSTALILNVFVSAVSFIQYYKSGYFQWKLFLPFAVTSIPAAFIGGMIKIDDSIYRIILAAMLLFSVMKLIGLNIKTTNEIKKQSIFISLVIGALIGFVSGMIGIGGGIILSPVILLLHWADLKQTAAVSALFILVNSIAGLAGVFRNEFHFTNVMGIMIITAFAGGLIGSYFGAKRFNELKLRYLLSAVLIIAAVKLVFT